MGLSVRLVRGVWVKGESGLWKHEPDLTGQNIVVRISEHTAFRTLTMLVKEKLGVRSIDDVELTYQWPHWMLGPDWGTAEPINIVDDEDTSLFLAIRADLEEVYLRVRVVPFGSENNVNSYSSRFDVGTLSSVADNPVRPAYHYMLPNQPPQYGYYRPLSNGGIIWPGIET